MLNAILTWKSTEKGNFPSFTNYRCLKYHQQKLDEMQK